jgi:uncharacterized protein YkwD
MSKKALSIILLTGIVLSACGGQATQVTDIPTALPATTAPPATETPATETPTTETPSQADIPVTGDTTQTQETNTATPTTIPTVFVPENAVDCVNRASFVSDVTIPDNTPTTAGAAFTKTWRIQNTGTCIWWSGYTVAHYSENAMSAPASSPLPVTNPGETADVSVDLVAPSLAGTYRGNFVVKNPAGLIMQIDEDSRLWLIINVTSAPTGTPTNTATASSTALSDGTAPSDGSPTATVSGSGSTTTSATCAFTIDVPRTEQVAAAINTYRSQNSLIAYTVNPQLSQAAQRQANDMACNKLFFHSGSDGSTPQTRVADTGYVATRVTENVHGNYPPYNPGQVVNWWKLDQTDLNHNRNMISTQYTEIGVGYAFFNNFGYYVVVFATP